MRTAKRAIVVVLGTALMLSACGNRNKAPDLMTFDSSGPGPDEFTILPGKPLQSPESFAELPTPTPGGANRTDPTPEADAVAALGGNPATVTRDGTLGADGGLITHTTRFGVSQGIRQALAAEDLEFRRDNNGRILERLFNVNVYYDSYSAQSLDQHAELLRLRRLGIRTPAAPPNPVIYPQ